MEEVSRRSYELGLAFNRLRSPEEIARGIDHTMIQRFDFDGRLIETIVPKERK